MKRKWIAILLATAFIWCSAMAVLTAIDMRRTWENRAACSIGSLASRDLSLLTALYPDLPWTAYAQSPREIASGQLPARASSTAVLSFLGAPERIALFPLMSGRLPLDGEQGACAVDANTAFELFRSTDVDGNLIRLDGEAVRVVGVMDVARPLLLTPATREGKLERLVADDREGMLALSSALGVEPDPFELNGAELAKLAELMCAIPWLMAFAAVPSSLRRRGGRWRFAGAALNWALLLGAVLALLLCVPVRLLPARWSDLAFYGEQAAAFQTRPFRASDARDALLRWDVLRTGLWCAAACALLSMERMWMRCERSQ